MQTLRKFYQKLNKVSDCLLKAIGILVAGMVVASILVVLLQVLNRYVLCKISDISIHFTDELSRYLMIWNAYLAIAMCLREGSMARVDILYTRLGKKARMLLYLLTCAMTFVFYFVVIRYGIVYSHVMRAFKTSMLKWPGNIVYLAPVVGAVLMALESVIELIGVLSGELEPFQAGKGRKLFWQEEPEEEGGQ